MDSDWGDDGFGDIDDSELVAVLNNAERQVAQTRTHGNNHVTTQFTSHSSSSLSRSHLQRLPHPHRAQHGATTIKDAFRPYDKSKKPSKRKERQPQISTSYFSRENIENEHNGRSTTSLPSSTSCFASPFEIAARQKECGLSDRFKLKKNPIRTLSTTCANRRVTVSDGEGEMNSYSSNASVSSPSYGSFTSNTRTPVENTINVSGGTFRGTFSNGGYSSTNSGRRTRGARSIGNRNRERASVEVDVAVDSRVEGKGSVTSFDMDVGIDISLLPQFDRATNGVWVYPTNYPVRDYQFNIVKTCLLNNTMVSLPTGLGKTFIAAVLMFNYYRWFPQGVIIFMAPTRPLVGQQIEACYNITGIKKEDTAELTGHTKADERIALWRDRRMMFLTPQVLVNDLKSGACDAKRIVCLVFDEAHKASGNSSYCQVMRSVTQVHRRFRVLALSATPGDQIEKVRNVIEALLITKLELRTDQSIDIQPYTHARTVEVIVVQLNKGMTEIRDRFAKILDKPIAALCNSGAFHTRTAENVSKFGLLQALDKYKRAPLPNTSPNAIMSTFFLCISLQHAYGLLVTTGLLSFYSYIKGCQLESGKNSGATLRNHIKSDPALQLLLRDLATMCDPEINNTDTGKRMVSHPKFAKLSSVLQSHFEKYGTNSRVMIFSHYRDSVVEIVRRLKEHAGFKVAQFVGQAAGKTSSGLKQKEQIAVLESFRSGTFNILVATSVGEEGLDIGDLDLIICFDAQGSATRLVQRMGRCGRKRKGRVVMLVTEGKEHQKYKTSVTSKNGINKSINKHIDSLPFYARNPDMVPSDVDLKCSKLHIEVLQPFDRDYTTGRKNTKGSKRPLDGGLNAAEEELCQVRYAFSNALEPLKLNKWTTWQNAPSVVKLGGHSTRSVTMMNVLQLMDDLLMKEDVVDGVLSGWADHLVHSDVNRDTADTYDLRLNNGRACQSHRTSANTKLNESETNSEENQGRVCEPHYDSSPVDGPKRKKQRLLPNLGATVQEMSKSVYARNTYDLSSDDDLIDPFKIVEGPEQLHACSPEKDSDSCTVGPKDKQSQTQTKENYVDLNSPQPINSLASRQLRDNKQPADGTVGISDRKDMDMIDDVPVESIASQYTNRRRTAGEIDFAESLDLQEVLNCNVPLKRPNDGTANHDAYAAVSRPHCFSKDTGLFSLRCRTCIGGESSDSDCYTDFDFASPRKNITPRAFADTLLKVTFSPHAFPTSNCFCSEPGLAKKASMSTPGKDMVLSRGANSGAIRTTIEKDQFLTDTQRGLGVRERVDKNVRVTEADHGDHTYENEDAGERKYVHIGEGMDRNVSDVNILIEDLDLNLDLDLDMDMNVRVNGTPNTCEAVVDADVEVDSGVGVDVDASCSDKYSMETYQTVPKIHATTAYTRATYTPTDITQKSEIQQERKLRLCTSTSTTVGINTDKCEEESTRTNVRVHTSMYEKEDHLMTKDNYNRFEDARVSPSLIPISSAGTHVNSDVGQSLVSPSVNGHADGNADKSEGVPKSMIEPECVSMGQCADVNVAEKKHTDTHQHAHSTHTLTATHQHRYLPNTHIPNTSCTQSQPLDEHVTNTFPTMEAVQNSPVENKKDHASYDRTCGEDSINAAMEEWAEEDVDLNFDLFDHDVHESLKAQRVAVSPTPARMQRNRDILAGDEVIAESEDSTCAHYKVHTKTATTSNVITTNAITPKKEYALPYVSGMSTLQAHSDIHPAPNSSPSLITSHVIAPRAGSENGLGLGVDAGVGESVSSDRGIVTYPSSIEGMGSHVDVYTNTDMRKNKEQNTGISTNTVPHSMNDKSSHMHEHTYEHKYMASKGSYGEGMGNTSLANLVDTLCEGLTDETLHGDGDSPNWEMFSVDEREDVGESQSANECVDLFMPDKGFVDMNINASVGLNAAKTGVLDCARNTTIDASKSVDENQVVDVNVFVAADAGNDDDSLNWSLGDEDDRDAVHLADKAGIDATAKERKNTITSSNTLLNTRNIHNNVVGSMDLQTETNMKYNTNRISESDVEDDKYDFALLSEDDEDTAMWMAEASGTHTNTHSSTVNIIDSQTRTSAHMNTNTHANPHLHTKNTNLIDDDTMNMKKRDSDECKNGWSDEVNANIVQLTEETSANEVSIKYSTISNTDTHRKNNNDVKEWNMEVGNDAVIIDGNEGEIFSKPKVPVRGTELINSLNSRSSKSNETLDLDEDSNIDGDRNHISSVPFSSTPCRSVSNVIAYDHLNVDAGTQSSSLFASPSPCVVRRRPRNGRAVILATPTPEKSLSSIQANCIHKPSANTQMPISRTPMFTPDRKSRQPSIEGGDDRNDSIVASSQSTFGSLPLKRHRRRMRKHIFKENDTDVDSSMMEQKDMDVQEQSHFPSIEYSIGNVNIADVSEVDEKPRGKGLKLKLRRGDGGALSTSVSSQTNVHVHTYLSSQSPARQSNTPGKRKSDKLRLDAVKSVGVVTDLFSDDGDFESPIPRVQESVNVGTYGDVGRVKMRKIAKSTKSRRNVPKLFDESASESDGRGGNIAARSSDNDTNDDDDDDLDSSFINDSQPHDTPSIYRTLKLSDKDNGSTAHSRVRINVRKRRPACLPDTPPHPLSTSINSFYSSTGEVSDDYDTDGLLDDHSESSLITKSPRNTTVTLEDELADLGVEEDDWWVKSNRLGKEVERDQRKAMFARLKQAKEKSLNFNKERSEKPQTGDIRWEAAGLVVKSKGSNSVVCISQSELQYAFIRTRLQEMLKGLPYHSQTTYLILEQPPPIPAMVSAQTKFLALLLGNPRVHVLSSDSKEDSAALIRILLDRS
eukprot:CFRG2951T1